MCIITKSKLRLSDYENLLRLAKFMGINHPETLSHKSLVKAVWYIIKRPPVKETREELLLKVITNSFKV